MRLAEIAARLSELTGRDDAKIHAVLRAPAMKPLLRVSPGPTPKSPGDYAPLELLRARLLLAGQGCGLSVAELARVNVALNKAIPPKEGGRVPTHLEALAAGEEWIVRVRFNEDMAGERQAYVTIGPEAELTDKVSERAHAAQRGLDHETELGVLVIPAHRLVAPLLPLLTEG
ncbi:hypothetical protein LV780_17050 [Cereibacter azotoformans]|uniref:Uncharacterized protein n=1 Tax=Cereibacter azotoformans TaxID=43057 RepID=A0A2T5JPU5_9RHOB|nr:hypothetical protein [Cereibacter azotoformans]PTR09680.1 hypothetical protein C8J28_1323 [Cereibacter azotoformans]UIJ32824.1 hypothetical protein LV780_17050 [Cereibacter azotoformans]